ncbi:AraC family transcriptional regulator [Agrobacterium tumefaciens]|nr:AraC family transcriptional regulator [Agrobacterium tumefaciens]NTE74536.1 AraC family transcriptional regulator [Agrobacterium tumefaciens]
MCESLTDIAPFEALTPESVAGFQWSTNAWSDGIATLTEIVCNRPWQIKATSHSPHWLTINVPIKGSCAVARGQAFTRAHPGQILLAQNHEIDWFHMEGMDHRTDDLHVDWGVITQAIGDLIEMPVAGHLDLMPLVTVDMPSGLLMRNLVETIMSGMRGDGLLLRSPIAMSNLTQTLVHIIARSIPHRYSKHLEKTSFAATPWHVRRAIEFMQCNISKPITIGMVAQAANVSVRTLENGFRTFKEMTPARYLRTLRLRAARQELLDPTNNASVRDVRLKWGFFHSGRFASLYRSVYGELPQETLKCEKHTTAF